MSNLPQAGKVIARLHSVELATSAEQINWARIDRVIVLNAAIEARLQMLARQPLPPVVMVANGVDMERFKPRPRQFQHRLGMVCNLLPIKRVYEVVLCVHQLRQEGYPFTLQVAGRPMDRERRYDWALRALVQELGLTESVRFSGWVDDVAAWLGHIDVFISNSYWEGQQTALLEAMASGCYCLAHCWAGVEEVLPLENVFVTDADLCQKLVSYAGLAEAGKERAQAEMRRIAEERFDERRMVAELIAVIEAVARGTA
jgi:glycosyltransferase involved in cell wall biosynthesis